MSTPKQTPVAKAPVADTSSLPTVTDVPTPTATQAENPVPATNRDTPILIQGEQPQVTPQQPADVIRLTQASEVPTIKVEVTVPQNQKPKGETVKVKVLRSHPSFGYFAGDEAEISQDSFDKAQQDGPFFEEIKSVTDAETPPTGGIEQRKQTR